MLRDYGRVPSVMTSRKAAPGSRARVPGGCRLWGAATALMTAKALRQVGARFLFTSLTVLLWEQSYSKTTTRVFLP